MAPREVDWIVIGAGSAGCALAARLAEDDRTSVLLLEHGGSDAGPLIQMPAALSMPMNMRRYDWGYVTEPEPHLGGRRLAAPRGKVVGGSSSINGMVYVRGHPLDFEGWAEAGARGWGFADVLPYFRRMECWHGPGDPEGWRGTDGPLHVTRGRRANPLYTAFIEAGRQAGYAVTQDYNGAMQEGFGPMEMTVWQGRRWSAANAYLRPALGRHRGLVLLKGALVTRIDLQGRRAVGCSYRRRGIANNARARRGVVLAAGAFNSPRLLMLSGIGDGAHLSTLGIETRHHLPGVGCNLQDHLEVYFQTACREPVTLFGYWNLAGKARVLARWLWDKGGPGASNHFEACGFIRSRAGLRCPDIQYHFLPLAVRYDGRAAAEGHGYQVHVGPMHPRSRGRIALRSPDPLAPPSIRFDYLSAPGDMEDFIRCLRLTREVLGQPAFERWRGKELLPGANVRSDEALADFVRAHAESAYHPCGTCRMGDPGDPMAVVDPACRVIGIEGLHVADSSIFPKITNGNINAPTIMVAEKAADHLRGRPPFAPDPMDYRLREHWQTRQR